MKTACVILAAGLGTRMKSDIPKVLHNVCGIPMIQHVVDTADALNPERIIIVVGQNAEQIKTTVTAKDISYILQKEPKGTGHALRCARPALKGFKGTVIIFNGDTPLLRPDTLKTFLNQHLKNGNAVSVLSFEADKPDGYGRIIRDAYGNFKSIIEHKDADQRQREIREVNSGIYALNSEALTLLDAIRINRAKGEYYLTDIVAIAVKRNMKTASFCIGKEEEFMGVNTRAELHRASQIMRKNIIKRWIENGVNFVDIETVYIHPYVTIGRETTIYPNVYIEGKSNIGNEVTIFPNVRIVDSEIRDCVVIKDSSVIEGSIIKEKASVGPFAHIRPGCEVGDSAKIGNFVELKKAIIGSKTKASHLSYLGDARIGSDVNIGAGTITCNYDGKDKFITIIKDGAFIGSDTQLVAPVTVGKASYIGAGSTITKDVPAHSLALSRIPQRHIKNWAKKRAVKQKKPKGG